MNINIDKIKDCINYLISTNKIVIFSKTFCPYSSFVKEVFDALREVYKTIELDTLKDGKYWLDTLTTITGSKCVPQVFINGKYVGGAQEIQALLKSGDLQRMFKLTYPPPDMPIIAAKSGSGSPRGQRRRLPREPSTAPLKEPSRESFKEPPRSKKKKRRKSRGGKTSQDSTCRCKTTKGPLQGSSHGTS